MNHDFCTYFDHRYLPRAIVMHRSLRRTSPGMRLWALCMDDAAYDALRRLGLPDLVPIRLTEFEAGDDELTATRAERSTVEYYFTCTPSLPLWVLRQDPKITDITYVDADLKFFAPVQPLFDGLGDASVSVVPHRFPPGREADIAHGIYNVGWLTFRPDIVGLNALQWWRERCLEWCFDRIEDGKYADQRYLDDWPERFGAAVLSEPGVNLAPWNLARHTLTRGPHGLLVDGEPLIFYHFHGVKKFVPRVYDVHLETYGVRLSNLITHDLYRPYLRELEAATSRARQLLPGLRNPSLIRNAQAVPRRTWKAYVRAAQGVAQRRYLLLPPPVGIAQRSSM